MKVAALTIMLITLVAILAIANAGVYSRRSTNAMPQPLSVKRTEMPIGDAGQLTTTDETAFDGEWWNVSTPQVQFGFVNGYYDCYQYDTRAPNTAKGSIVEFQKAVSHFYETHQDQLRTSVPTVLRDLAVSYKSPRVRLQGGEVWNELHGYYDGMWWKQSEPEQQIGYLEGYLTCYSHDVPLPSARFSEGPAKYQKLITQYYGDPKHTEDDKIADVLYRFRDMRTQR